MRNEKKIVLAYEQYLVLSARMRAMLSPDPHCTDPQGYFISSLYFDDMHETAYQEKQSGTPARKKYRIRIYNGDLSRITLECKEKKLDRIEKVGERLSLDTYQALLHGNPAPLADMNTPLAREVYALCKTKHLTPRVAVTYRREAYLHPLSNTRITFDKELRAGYTAASMLTQGVNDLPVFPTAEYPYPGAVILEIKYDEMIASHIAQALRTGGIVQAASKYCLCRDMLHMAGKQWQ
ncbi:MAG: polyphosphate polymerase domain-containing protein [Clostridia bacterium]|nr:polyphosphate polymerase domain-containing protein [Clostridia bacterium]